MVDIYFFIHKVNFRYVITKKTSTFTFQQFCAKNLQIQPKLFKLFVQKHSSSRYYSFQNSWKYCHKLNDARETGNYLKSETLICKVADLSATRLKILPARFISSNSLTQFVRCSWPSWMSPKIFPEENWTGKNNINRNWRNESFILNPEEKTCFYKVLKRKEHYSTGTSLDFLMKNAVFSFSWVWRSPNFSYRKLKSVFFKYLQHVSERSYFNEVMQDFTKYLDVAIM